MAPVLHSLFMTSIKVTLLGKLRLKKERRVSRGDYCNPLLGKYKQTKRFFVLTFKETFKCRLR